MTLDTLKTQLEEDRAKLEAALASCEQRAAQLRAALLKTIGGLEALAALKRTDV